MIAFKEIPAPSRSSSVSSAPVRSSSRLARGRAVVAEGRERLDRQGVDRVGSNQLLDVQHIAIAGILDAGAGPQEALPASALGFQGLPARAGEDPLVDLVGDARVGDRDLSE